MSTTVLSTSGIDQGGASTLKPWPLVIGQKSGMDVVGISIANIPVPMFRVGERVSALIAVNEASLSVIGYVLADGGAQAHYMRELLAKSVKCVRHSNPNVPIMLTIDHGREIQGAVKYFPIQVRTGGVRYRSPSERRHRCWERAFTKFMLQAHRSLHRPDGKLTGVSRAELEIAMNSAINVWHETQLAVQTPLKRRQVERAFRAELAKVTDTDSTPR